MKLAIAGAVLCAISFPHLVAAADVPQYQYVDLGSRPASGWWVVAQALNNVGGVAGEFVHPDGGGTEAFQYSSGQIAPLPLPVQFGSSRGINERGEITGIMSADSTFATYRSFFFSSSRGALDLGQLSVGGTVEAAAINASGFVTGRAELSAGGTWHAFLWDPSTGVMKNLGSPNGSYSEGKAINSAGVVAANVTSKTTRNAFIYDKGVSTIIAPGKVSAVGSRSISDDGFVTGGYEVAPGQMHTFLWSKGKLTDLGTLGGATSGPLAMNASHQIVGTSDTATNERHVFLYDGKMKDLTALALTAGVPLVKEFGMRVRGINSLGYVLLDTGSFNIGATGIVVYKKGRFEQLNPYSVLGSGGSGPATGPVSINDVGQVVGQYQDFDRSFIATPISLLFQRLWDAVVNFPTLRTSEGAAWTAYANYDVKTSDARLAQFITDVNTLVAQKKLSTTLGNRWVADAQAIRAAMKGQP